MMVNVRDELIIGTGGTFRNILQWAMTYTSTVYILDIYFMVVFYIVLIIGSHLKR